MCKDDVYGIIVVKSFATTKILHVVLHVRSSTLYSNRQFRQESRLVPRVRHCEKGDTDYLLLLGGSHPLKSARKTRTERNDKRPRSLACVLSFPMKVSVEICPFVFLLQYALICMHKTEFERNSFLDFVLLCHASWNSICYRIIHSS